MSKNSTTKGVKKPGGKPQSTNNNNDSDLNEGKKKHGGKPIKEDSGKK